MKTNTMTSDLVEFTDELNEQIANAEFNDVRTYDQCKDWFERQELRMARNDAIIAVFRNVFDGIIADEVRTYWEIGNDNITPTALFDLFGNAEVITGIVQFWKFIQRLTDSTGSKYKIGDRVKISTCEVYMFRVEYGTPPTGEIEDRLYSNHDFTSFTIYTTVGKKGAL